MTTPLEKLCKEACEKLEPLFADRRNRTFPAKILDKDDQVLAEGNARLGSESDPGNIYYPKHQGILPEEVSAHAVYIEIAANEKVKRALHSMTLCENGTERHYHVLLDTLPSAPT